MKNATPPTKGSRRPSRRKAPTTLPAPSPVHPAAREAGEAPVTLAVAIGAHGVAGEVRLKTFTDDLSPYRRFNNGALTLERLRPGPHGAVARFAEIGDRAAAEALRGTELTVPRSLLPPLGEGEYYHADLIGLVCDVDGVEVGRIAAVENFGAGDILEVERPDGRRLMVPIAAAQLGERIALDPAFVD